MKFHFFLFLILLLFLVINCVFAVKTIAAPKKIKTDTSKAIVKGFSKAALSKYQKDKEFDYNGTSSNEPSAVDLFWRWLWGKISDLFTNEPFAGSFIKYAFYLIAIAFLIFLVFKAIGIDATQILTGRSQKIEIGYNEVIEDIFEINFDAEIENAISKANFRLAVRLLYLKSLKQMSDKGLINWQVNKTNANYLSELVNTEQKQSFALLTRQFEFIWYGNFYIDKESFNNISLLFQNFTNYLK